MNLRQRIVRLRNRRKIYRAELDKYKSYFNKAYPGWQVIPSVRRKLKKAAMISALRKERQS